MATKRKRKSTVANREQTAKRAKQDIFPLLSLPPELINHILAYVLPYPNHIEHSCRPYTCVATLFRSPILQVCQHLRDVGLQAIANDCLWITITANSRDALESFSTMKKFEFPIVPPLFRNLLPQQPGNAISFVLGSQERQRTTRRFVEEETTLIFPYNYSSLFRLCTILREGEYTPRCLSVRVPQAMTGSRWEWFKEIIYPVLETAEGEFEFDIQITGGPDLFSDFTIRKSPRAAHNFYLGMRYRLKDALLTLKAADDLEAAGLHDEAALWLCNRGMQLLLWSTLLLPKAHEWERGEADPDDPDLLPKDLRAPGRNALGNQLRSTMHSMEYRACLGYYRLFQKYGLDFIDTHHALLTWYGQRWWTEEAYPWFGLSQQELSEVHHARALTRAIKIRAFSFLFGFDDALLDPEWDGYDEEDEEIEDEDVDEYRFQGLHEMSIACALQPENADFRALYDTFWQYDPTRAYHFNWYHEPGTVFSETPEDTFYLVSHITYQSSDGQTEISWRGDRARLWHWGGERMLRYLPMAQKKMDENELTSLLED